MVFGNSFMRGPFRAISGHGVGPLILGTGITAQGHSYMFVRSMALVICAVWISLEIGVRLSESKWSEHWKLIVFVMTWCLLGCLAMGVMYWFLDSTLEDQETSVYEKLTVQAFLPAPHDPLKMGVTATNAGNTDIGDRKITCYINRISYYPNGGMDGFGMRSTLSEKSTLKASGDGETSYCTAAITRSVPNSYAYCADITVSVSYVLTTQPLIQKEKKFRFVAKNEDFVFRQQTVDYPKSFCPMPKEPFE